jgi:hypothetical protein
VFLRLRLTGVVVAVAAKIMVVELVPLALFFFMM